MTGLLAGIVNKHASLSGSIPGGIQPGEADEGLAYPYTLYRVVVPGFDQAYAGSNIATSETVQVQFDVIGEGFVAVGTLCETLASTYRDGVTATSGTNYSASQVTACFPDPEPLGKNASGNDVWRWSVTLEFSVC